MSGATTDASRRVKLYALNASRQWDDKGTGHITSCYHEPLDGMSLLVRNESDGSLLLESKIQIDTLYQRQQGTLIVWSESDNCDLALSFQEVEGCNEIWERICNVQGRDPSCDQDVEEEHEEIRINLVDCDPEKLHLIQDQITAFSQTTRRRDALAAEYIENNYIHKLLTIFKQAEVNQDLDTLYKLYEIFKQLFLYDRPTLTEVLIGPEAILMDVIGVLEYEPPTNFPDQTDEDTDEMIIKKSLDDVINYAVERTMCDDDQANQSIKLHDYPVAMDYKKQTTLLQTTHRDFLRNGTTFKEVIPFGDDKLVDKIHQTFRVQYLQNTVLPTPSILEENAYASLTNILFFYKVEIVTMIQDNEKFLKSLFDQIISSEIGLDRKRELVLFLREYCTFSQTIQPKQRESFFKTLAALKILSAVEVALSSNDQTIKSAAMDIFTYLVEYSPNMTREHAVQQGGGMSNPPNNNAQTANILKLVIEHITTDQDPELGTATQLSCIIKLLLDPENMPGDDIGKHSFLEFFYYTCMQSLVEPIHNSTTPSGDIEPCANDRRTAQLLSIMLELLTFFIEHHYNQLRNYLVSTDLLTRSVSLIKSRHKFLVLSVIRFFRRLIATKDEIYFDLIISKSLFNPIIQVFKDNNGRYNLLDSAILELFEFIKQEEIFVLINHVLTEYGPYLDSIEYVNTFKIMRQTRENLQNAIKDSAMKPKTSMDNSQMYFGSASRREMENMWFGSIDADVDDVVTEVSENDSDKNLDSDSGDATIDSESDSINLPETDLEFTMNGSKNDDTDADDEDEEDDELEEDEVEDEEDDETDDNELEPSFKRKKTK